MTRQYPPFADCICILSSSDVTVAETGALAIVMGDKLQLQRNNRE